MRNRDDWPENEMYHTYHADRQKVPPPTKPKPGKPKVFNLFLEDRKDNTFVYSSHIPNTLNTVFKKKYPNIDDFNFLKLKL